MKRLIGLAMSLAVLATAVWAFAPRPLPPFPATALRADGLQINGIARAGERLVAVGERGKILFSDDRGGDWRVAAVDKPQGATLTQVAFADSRHGIAVGHSGLDKPGGPIVQLLMLTFVGGILAAGLRTKRATQPALA